MDITGIAKSHHTKSTATGKPSSKKEWNFPLESHLEVSTLRATPDTRYSSTASVASKYNRGSNMYSLFRRS